MDKHLFTQVLILFLLLSGKPTKADSKHHASVLPGGRVRQILRKKDGGEELPANTQKEPPGNAPDGSMYNVTYLPDYCSGTGRNHLFISLSLLRRFSSTSPV
jgi:hypothetical protein